MVKNDSYYISSDNLTSRSDHGLDGLSGGGLLKHISDRLTICLGRYYQDSNLILLSVEINCSDK